MKIKLKNTVTQRLQGKCATHTRTEVSARDVGLVIDEPPERGGGNMGPTPTETMLSALIACTNVISNKCAKNLGIEYETVSINAEASFDNRGTRLLEEIEVPYPKIQLTINVKTPASDEEMERLRSDLQRFCPLAKIIRNAGTEIEEIWNVQRP
jgi:putative redox protein